MGVLTDAAITYATESNPLAGDSGTFKVKTGKPQAGAAQCTDQEMTADNAAVNPPAAANSAWKKYKYTATAKLADHRPILSISMTSSSCDDTGGGGATWATAVTSCSGVGGGKTVTPIAQTKPTPTAEALYSPEDNSQNCAAKVQNDIEKKDNKKVILAALRQAQQAAAETVKSLGDITPETLANDESFITALRNGIQKYATITDTTKESETKNIKEHIKEMLGKEASKFKTEFIDNINKRSISYRGPKKIEKTTIGDLALTPEAAAAITYLRSQKVSKTGPKQAETEPTSNTAQKCKEDTEENECKKDKDCEHKEGKCKLKEGVKAENDKKITNTTGSNSFVINKTPLLLTILLF
ncbi:hypothetical protein DPX39_060073300 [Trypanosoma brucei equiperdum]|uniref:Variant surface glycoprotein n=1 Tax=Trypanosoma brucei equiperdum TaxID=630700 RepID=A0A3L6LBP3_9TRYP|nr:hypothetical protein DPX39_060079500 [Trypanosoma brucei equiperdum]RHW71810.1 hypothetical protein DPX39_060067300 [Trypanosoma brucei equiperdum]RHW71941.1 hypothetical protein DPX39_060061200 [Trypanosoma brucei equiperdum]RHW72245.1 hypothetical protein DPX39_060073300 [Trypanosoma brucei equiperdum]